MSTTVTIDGTNRVYKNSQLPRYKSRLSAPGTGLGVCNVAASTVLTDSCEAHMLKSISPAGTGQRSSLTLRDVVNRADGTTGEVTVVINVYHDDTHDADLDRASALITGSATMLTADTHVVLSEMSDLGVVDV